MNYNLPKTPLNSRFFVRLIKSIRRSLRKLLNVLKVDYEDLFIALVEIQRVITNLLLTYNYDDVCSQPITPNHVIFGWRLDINYFNENSTLVEINQFVEKSIEQIRKLWIEQYLGLLREQLSYVKNKNHPKRDMICVGV